MDNLSHKCPQTPQFHQDVYKPASPHVENRHDDLNNARYGTIPQQRQLCLSPRNTAARKAFPTQCKCVAKNFMKENLLTPGGGSDLAFHRDAPAARGNNRLGMDRPSSPVSVSLPFDLQHVCASKDVDTVGWALLHRIRCKRNCSVCRSVDNLLRQVRDHKRRQHCPSGHCNFCRKWAVVLHRHKKFLLVEKKRGGSVCIEASRPS